MSSFWWIHISLSLPLARLTLGTSGAVSSCTNDEYYVHEANPAANCGWIRWKEDRRQEYCKIEEVHEFCPQTCGDCCEDDLNYIFENNRGFMVNCNWLISNSEQLEEKKLEYCNGFWSKGYTVRDMCSKSCDFCKPFVPLDMFDQQKPTNPDFLTEMPQKNSESFPLSAIVLISCIVILGGIIAYATRGPNVTSKMFFPNDSASFDSTQSFTYDQSKDGLAIFTNETDQTKLVVLVKESTQKNLERQIGVNSTIELPPTPTSTNTDMSESSKDKYYSPQNNEDCSLRVTFDNEKKDTKAFNFVDGDCYRCGNIDQHSSCAEDYISEEKHVKEYELDTPENLDFKYASSIEEGGDTEEYQSYKALNSDIVGCKRCGISKDVSKKEVNSIRSSQSDYSKYGSTITILNNALKSSLSNLTS